MWDEPNADPEEADESPAVAPWMATFADMMTLLLTFFVLLLSFSTTDIIRFRMALGSVKDALGVRYKHVGDHQALSTSPVELSDEESSDRLRVFDDPELIRKVQDLVEGRGMDEAIEVVADARGIIVRIRGQILFDTGSAELLPEASAPLDAVAAIGRLVPFPIAVEGHTDNRPISNDRYPSNWELSTARATQAMRYLVGEGGLDEDRMRVAGYSDIRPVAPNTTEQGQARNRRVEFVFIRPMEAPASPATGPGLRADTEAQDASDTSDTSDRSDGSGGSGGSDGSEGDETGAVGGDGDVEFAVSKTRGPG